ncbi:HPr family phosphocarrier protein [Spiroplasma endosymbiont of Anurida maritima]|uniref:HPr family phosphocarrier protein n=1 Tax=Spiroplasma endosymbiont of Anurida maritima TaxID=2967972 RepID=UPI0036D34BA3
MAKILKIKITDPKGLHARPAALLVSTAGKFDSKLTIKSENGTEGDLKSIMNILSIGITVNTNIEIIADGSDEADAIVEIKKLFIDNELSTEENIK